MIDDGTSFKAAFTVACDSLEILYECAVKCNQKSLLVGKFHRFLNKVVTIAASDRDILHCFGEVRVSVGYAWNCASIYGTDIIRSIPAISREFRFPLNISLTSSPKLTEHQANYVVEYLRLIDKDTIFLRRFFKF